MKPSATTSQSGSSSTPRRVIAVRSALVVTGVLIGLAAVLVAMFEWGPLRRPVPEDAARGREASSQRVPSRTERTPVPRPSLPPTASASAAPAERPSTRAETKVVVTQMKVQKYVEEAYPAWLRAHPGKECPRQLIELNEYMEDKDTQDTKDGWGRPLKMLCGASRSGKGFKVISYGRDGEVSEDDIKFGE